MLEGLDIWRLHHDLARQSIVDGNQAERGPLNIVLRPISSVSKNPRQRMLVLAGVILPELPRVLPRLPRCCTTSIEELLKVIRANP